MRAGTENVPGTVGIGKAAECSAKILKQKMEYEQKLQQYLIDRLREEIPGLVLNGSERHRLPNNVNVSIRGINGPALVALLDLEGICASSGSACAHGNGKPSHVQLAIGKNEEEAYQAVRFTLGIQNTKEELEDTVNAVRNCVQRLRTAY